jgi:hypothetical protein
MSEEHLPESKKEQSTFFRQAKEILAVFGSIVGLLVAYLWIAGRSFFYGFYDQSLGIPFQQIDLSIWEYAEGVWRHIFLYIVVLIIGGSIIIALIILVGPLAKQVANWAMNKVARKYKRKTREGKAAVEWAILKRSLMKASRLILLALSVLLAALAALYAVIDMSAKGVQYGQAFLADNRLEVELVSDIPLALDNLDRYRSNSDSLIPTFVYTGYRLLLHDSGRYYIADDFDAVTCKPRQVYVISDEHLVQVNLIPAPPLSSKCSSMTSSPPQAP